MLDLVVNWLVSNTMNIRETNIFSLFSNLSPTVSNSFSYNFFSFFRTLKLVHLTLRCQNVFAK